MRIAYSNADGTVSIFTAAPRKMLERFLGRLTEEQYREHIYKRAIPANAKNVTELPDDWSPPDRAKRSLWRIRNDAVVIEEEQPGDAG